MEVIKWTEEYSIGIKEIDIQHKKFIDTINRLYKAINKMEFIDNSTSIFKELEDYSSYHFDTEERYFDKFNYSGAEEHKREHLKFKKKIKSIEKKYLKKEDVSFEIVDFLEDWLIEHLNTMDRKYIKCFKENGLK